MLAVTNRNEEEAMSAQGLQQLTDDLKSQPELAKEFANAGGLDDVVSLAQGKGYDVTADDVKAAAEAKGGGTSSQDLQSLAAIDTTVVVLAVAVVAT
jgi:predicted ribosomally synthesized peptide with nif11-like leader